ncbi:TPA: hypothetical protein ACS72K_001082 [Providencia alcalifaciens]
MNKDEQYKDLDSMIEERNKLKEKYDSLRINHNEFKRYLISDFPDKVQSDFDNFDDYISYQYSSEKITLTKDYDKKCDELSKLKAELIGFDQCIYEYWYYNEVPLINQALYDKWKSERYSKSDDHHNFDTSTSCIADGVARMYQEVSVSDYIKSADTTNFCYQAIFGVPIYDTGF